MQKIQSTQGSRSKRRSLPAPDRAGGAVSVFSDATAFCVWHRKARSTHPCSPEPEIYMGWLHEHPTFKMRGQVNADEPWIQQHLCVQFSAHTSYILATVNNSRDLHT